MTATRVLVLARDTGAARRFADAAAARAAELGAHLVPAGWEDSDLPVLAEGADGFVVVTPGDDDGWAALGGAGAWKPVGFAGPGDHVATAVGLRLVPVRAAAAAALVDEVVRLGHALRPMREAARSAPGPLPGSYSRRLTADDAAEVTVLQRCCWAEEAVLNDSLGIPALHESVDEVRADLDVWHTTGLWRDGRLLGMVRTRRDGDDWHIGRLAVVPDLRGLGLGRWLLLAAEERAEPGCTRMTLVTGSKSAANLAFYRRAGYRPVPGADPAIVHLAKDAV